MKNILFCFLFVLFSVSVSMGQESSAKPQYAPGTLITIPPDIDYQSAANLADMVELLATLPEGDPALAGDTRFDPNIWAKNVRYQRSVWGLQFSFKPLRIVEVELPTVDGKLEKKAVWYLVYNVKNLGKAEIKKNSNTDIKVANPGGSIGSGVEEPLQLPVAGDVTTKDVPREAPLVVRNLQGVPQPQDGTDQPIRFVPQFVLVAHRFALGTKSGNDPETGKAETKTEVGSVEYVDQIIPLAIPVIIRREKMTNIPETTQSFPEKSIAPGQDFWGVAMWTDIDPRINEFSIYVSGLTNAYQWIDKTADDGSYINQGKPGEGRVLKRKTLKLNWWCVRDKFSVKDSQIYYGAKDEKEPQSIFDLGGDFNRDGNVDPAEKKRYDEMFQEADTDGNGIVNDAEKANYHRTHQDWLKPSYAYEWLFL